MYQGPFKKAKTCLTSMSLDLNRLLDFDVDVLGCRDRIGDLIPHIEAARSKIGKLSRGKKRQEVQHKAAMRMTVQVLQSAAAV
jgi:hypothetical protein